MNTRSIHFRLIMWYSSLILLVAVVFASYIYKSLETHLYNEMEQRLKRRAGQIAENILPQTYQKPVVIAKQIESVYSPEASNRFIRILRADNSILYVSGQPKDKSFDPENINHNNMIIVSTKANINGNLFTIEMGSPTEDIKTALHGLLLSLLFGLPFVVFLVSIGGYVLVNRALAPVEAIMATAEKISFGNLSNRLPVSNTGDVLEHLSVTLNQMLTRLDDAYQQASRFSADASHELRTPLAIMRCELESIVQEQELPDNLRERIGSVLEETERLSHIAENLLAISRLDGGEAKIEYKLFDFAALVKNTAEQISLLAENKAIKIKVVAPYPVHIYGDAAKLKQVVVNLLDNAIKYTQSGGNILLNIYAENNTAKLEVIDNGIGISAKDLPHIFERFYHTDKANSGGTGLGLLIVRAICQAHGGNIEIESSEGKGTICHVELPLAEKQEAVTYV